jgi:hypothetical protein
MKKNTIILITTLAIISLLFIGFTSFNNNETKSSISSNDIASVIENTNTIPDLYYGVDARFAPVTKDVVHNATTIYDFLNEGEKEQIEHIKSVDVTIIKDNQLSHIYAEGVTDELTEAQLKILKATDYFSHFTVRTEFRGKNKETGIIEDKFFGPHITVVPEKQAIYVDGNEALINYLKENSKANMQVIKDNKLGAIKLSFIINKQGIVTNVKHDAMTTGYTSIDEKLITLLKEIPGKWIPAKNADGEKIEQELVFTFGPRDGC